MAPRPTRSAPPDDRALESRIDELYRLPLDRFTPARNALAKELSGERAAEIRSLQKPSLAAWAVNQLYWRSRVSFERLAEATKRLADAQRSSLSGASVDLGRLMAARRQAARDALAEIHGILDAEGQRPTRSTIHEISRTIEALRPGMERGRLARALEPPGFEALIGDRPLRIGRGSRVRETIEKPPTEPGGATARERSEARSRLQGVKRARDEARRRLRSRERESRRLSARLEAARKAEIRARRSLERAGARVRVLEQDLERASESVKNASSALAERESHLVDARRRLDAAR